MPGAEIYKPIEPATVGPLPHFGPDFDMNDKVRSFLAGYYEATQRVDYFVGRILGLLEEYGVEEETLVIFSADHGPSHLSRGKTTAYEFGLRVPFIVRWPGKAAAGTHSDALVSFVDLMPTFLEVAGIERPKHLPGHSLVPVFNGRKPEGVRKYIYSAYVSHTTAYYLYWPTRTISDGRYKLICNVNGNGSTRRDNWMGTDSDPGLMQDNADQRIRDAYKASGPVAQQAYERSLTPPEFELYDLEADPGEIHNLAGLKKYADVERRLKEDLLNWRRETVADPFLNPAYVKAFNKDYAAKVAFYYDHNKDKEVIEGMSNLNRWGKWRLDMSRWIPVWDAGSYQQDPSR
jgi:N-sulfoglucosamine sulfohydrolase